MAAPLTTTNIKVYLDANLATFKPPASQQPDVQPDGYLATPHILNLLTGSYGTIPNPQSQGTIPKPWTAIQLIGALSAASQKNMRPYVESFRQMEQLQDSSGILALGEFCVNVGDITQQDAAAVQAVVTATQADPNWPETIAAPPVLCSQFIDSATGKPCTLEEHSGLLATTFNGRTPVPGLIAQALNRTV